MRNHEFHFLSLIFKQKSQERTSGCYEEILRTIARLAFRRSSDRAWNDRPDVWLALSCRLAFLLDNKRLAVIRRKKSLGFYSGRRIAIGRFLY